MPTQIRDSHFGRMPSGESVRQFTLLGNNVEVEILAYGGIVRALRVPDSRGKLADVVLGFDTFEPYLRNPAYFGCIVGRYANRIANGTFSLDSATYNLARNDWPNALHGGISGFDKRLWQVGQLNQAVQLTYHSEDGEEGYPGGVDVIVSYELADDTLGITYRARTDRTTVLNLTNHSYFNLAGEGSVLDHRLQIAADFFTPVDQSLIPTGEIRPVAGTPFDLREPHPIAESLSAPDEQLRIGHGYDHNFVLNHSPGEFALAAVLRHLPSGRQMQVHTDQPGMQLYAGNLLEGSIVGKAGRGYGMNAGLCLETQHFPDSPNRPEFPSTLVRPGEPFSSRTEFRFSTKQA